MSGINGISGKRKRNDNVHEKKSKHTKKDDNEISVDEASENSNEGIPDADNGDEDCENIEDSMNSENSVNNEYSEDAGGSKNIEGFEGISVSENNDVHCEKNQNSETGENSMNSKNSENTSDLEHNDGTANSETFLNLDRTADDILVTVKEESAFDNKVKTYIITVNDNIADVETFFTKVYDGLMPFLQNNGDIKVQFNLKGYFVENEYNEFSISTNEVFSKQIDVDLNSAFEKIKAKYQQHDAENDGAKQFAHLEVHIWKHICKRSSYLKLPKHIRPTQVVKVSNKNNKSFLWSVLCPLHEDIYNPSVRLLKQYSNELKMDNIEYPVTFDDMPKIEELNDMSFNVYMLKYSFKTKRKEIEGPVYFSEKRRERHINLLLLHDGPRNHYCYIKNLAGLVNPDMNGYICDGCLIFFDSERTLRKHRKSDCPRIKTVLPSTGNNILQYRDEGKEKSVPFVVYADFEAYLSPVDNKKVQKRKPNNTYTENVSKHVPYSFAYYIKCSDDSLSLLEVYSGEDCVTKFVEMLTADISRFYKDNPEKFTTDFVPVYFHNFTNYDAHFIIRGLKSVSVLGSKYSYKTIYHKIQVNEKDIITLRFLDSQKFLKDSLGTLTKNLRNEPEKFVDTRKNCINDAQFDLLTRKGVFPYEYIRSFDTLNETSLPSKEHFYDHINNTNISDEDYQRAKDVWKEFNCKNLREYSDLYLQTDVLLLCDIFENLRKFCINTYGLDPAHFYSESGLSREAMLKMTKVKLELLTNVDMLMFFKNSIRGGIAHCSKRHAVANNKYLSVPFDDNKKENYIMYYDANNLYGWAMTQPLPYGGFEWVDVETDYSKYYKVSDDSKFGYVLEVDLTYPDDEKTHDWHADLPFCPEKKSVPECDGERLITDLTSKERYIVHHSYLAQCLKRGLKLKKIHRILKFKQKPWLKPYIDFNTKKRMSATTDSEKDFFKLMNNSVFGKFIENVENYTTVKMFDHWDRKGKKEGAFNMIGSPDYNSHAICSENLMAVQLNHTKLKFYQPYYVGFCVLDLSKAHMYNFHYGFMKEKFGNDLKLLYTDTDSFVYQIFTDNFYEKMKNHLVKYFDTSDYGEDNIFGYPLVNKKEIGFFKDVYNGAVVEEFIGLRTKSYVIRVGEELKKVGGPQQMKDQLNIEDYRNCLYNNENLFKEMYQIRAVGHDIYTQKVRKLALSPKYILKRCLLENKVDTLPWGHYKLANVQSE